MIHLPKLLGWIAVRFYIFLKVLTYLVNLGDKFCSEGSRVQYEDNLLSLVKDALHKVAIQYLSLSYLADFWRDGAKFGGGCLANCRMLFYSSLPFLQYISTTWVEILGKTKNLQSLGWHHSSPDAFLTQSGCSKIKASCVSSRGKHYDLHDVLYCCTVLNVLSFEGNICLKYHHESSVYLPESTERKHTNHSFQTWTSFVWKATYVKKM